ncbi:MAG: aminotransferase class I/II-fold pyridoxal phosphate-dependent enzyme, partial [Clostridia bacterium]|nr:aminotransferase class I/II-fold pyridoxal phosphate-dependent enzyme [Clostridia bacterium]
MNFNTNFNDIAENYLFAEVADRVAAYTKAHPDKKILKLGIGDVTLPLAPEVIKALHSAVDDMSNAATFKGYGPYEGYDFLRKNIADYYKLNGVDLELSEIFVSDGAKSDLGNILDIFSKDNKVLVPDPVYPVY